MLRCAAARSATHPCSDDTTMSKTHHRFLDHAHRFIRVACLVGLALAVLATTASYWVTPDYRLHMWYTQSSRLRMRVEYRPFDARRTTGQPGQLSSTGDRHERKEDLQDPQVGGDLFLRLERARVSALVTSVVSAETFIDSRRSYPGLLYGAVEYSGGIRVSGAVFSLWYIIVLCMIGIVPSSVLSIARRLRQRRAGSEPQCANCSYNLTGNVSGVCPECGAASNDDRVSRG